MIQVTKESLETMIKSTEEVKQRFGFISMGQEYNLKAYRMLLERMRSEDYLDDLREEYHAGRL